MGNLVSIEYLNEHLNDKDIVIVDCRFNLTNPDQGRKDYKEGHIPGAFFLDLDKDLSGEKYTHGGRHPLPNIEVFVDKIEKIGIDNTKQVVIYDDQNGPFASRLWWMLKYLGHNRASVLNANYSTWKNQGYPISKEIPSEDKTNFNVDIQNDMILDVDQVKKITESNNYDLIDSRSFERFIGETEPIDLKAGHIPGAKNYFWEENVTENGVMKSKKQLESRFSSLGNNKNIAVYCGSGVTATVNMLALETIGKKAKLYIGGWSDWSSYEDNLVEKEI